MSRRVDGRGTDHSPIKTCPPAAGARRRAFGCRRIKTLFSQDAPLFAAARQSRRTAEKTVSAALRPFLLLRNKKQLILMAPAGWTGCTTEKIAAQRLFLRLSQLAVSAPILPQQALGTLIAAQRVLCLLYTSGGNGRDSFCSPAPLRHRYLFHSFCSSLPAGKKKSRPLCAERKRRNGYNRSALKRMARAQAAFSQPEKGACKTAQRAIH